MHGDSLASHDHNNTHFPLSSTKNRLSNCPEVAQGHQMDRKNERLLCFENLICARAPSWKVGVVGTRGGVSCSPYPERVAQDTQRPTGPVGAPMCPHSEPGSTLFR